MTSTAASATTLANVLEVLDRHYPLSSAEDWDRVGVVCGAPDWPVTKVLLTVDVTTAVVAQARDTAADLVIAHHPLLLRGIHSVDGRDPKGQMLLDLIGNRIGCITAHTNADIAHDGVCVALAETIGLTDLTHLDPRPQDRLDQLVCFVPQTHTASVVDALSAAGAGTIGDYDRCHFVSPGTGSFRPLPGANPFIGGSGRIEEVAEDRLEMVLPRRRRPAVLEALVTAHPYEEPAYHFLELAPTDTDRGIGRVGVLPHPMTAAAFAQQVADALPTTVDGVRLGGDPARTIQRVAVLAGAGDSHLANARAAEVDAYLTSDLRHHPASEALEHRDAPVLLDVAHWAAEWPWLARLGDQLTNALPGLTTQVSEINTAPWAAAYQRGSEH